MLPVKNEKKVVVNFGQAVKINCDNQLSRNS
jgi:hypothetical protein